MRPEEHRVARDPRLRERDQVHALCQGLFDELDRLRDSSIDVEPLRLGLDRGDLDRLLMSSSNGLALPSRAFGSSGRLGWSIAVVAAVDVLREVFLGKALVPCC